MVGNAGAEAIVRRWTHVADGHELLVTPEHTHGLVGLLLRTAAYLFRLRRHKDDAGAVQFLLGRIEARDSAGLPTRRSGHGEVGLPSRFARQDAGRFRAGRGDSLA